MEFDASALLKLIAEHPLALGLAVIVLVLIVQMYLFSRKLELLLKGGDGKSLEGTIRALDSRASALEKHASATSAALTNHEGRIARAVSGVSVKRFDPFQNAGGQQSFSSALLNEKGDGIVLSGIHARDGVRVYAKEVTNFTSERELSEDESGAIHEATDKLK